MDKKILQEKQLELAAQLIVPVNGTGYEVSEGDLIFTFDIQYAEDSGFVAVDVLSWPDQSVGIFTQVYEITVAYEPGYFAFREGPLLLQALEELCVTHKFIPDLLIVDGHGTAHPRRLGVASWLGIMAKVPTIGVAKDPLLKKAYSVENGKGSRAEIYDDKTLIGYVLRTQEEVKPVYVSSGHQISQIAAVKTIFALAGNYRIIEPIRRADQFARRFSKGEWCAGWSNQVPKF